MRIPRKRHQLRHSGQIPDHVIASNIEIAGKFTTLVAAVKATGLVETLKGTGPFTAFVQPTKHSQSCPPELSKAF